MGKEISTFGNIEIEKNKFYYHKTPTFLVDRDTEKVLVSNKVSFGEKNYKYSIGYLYNGNKVKILNIMLPKTSTYGESWMYYLIEVDELLEKYNTLRDKVSVDIKKNLIASLSIIKII